MINTLTKAIPGKPVLENPRLNAPSRAIAHWETVISDISIKSVGYEISRCSGWKLVREILPSYLPRVNPKCVYHLDMTRIRVVLLGVAGFLPFEVHFILFHISLEDIICAHPENLSQADQEME